MEKEILKLFAEQLSDSKLVLETKYKSHPEWSSLRALVLVSEIELRTSVLISAESLRDCETVASLCKEIKRQQLVR